MGDFTLRVLQCFEKAKLVNHYYWLHTEADGGTRIRVENLQRVIERMTRLRIEKRLVQFDGDNVRGNYERYSDHIIINVRAGQAPEWIRYTITKELCHALNDADEEFSPDAAQTIHGLVKYAGLFVGDETSPVLQSERLAEIVALELLYPIEFRENDIRAQRQISDIIAIRGVPSPFVQQSHEQDHLGACKHFWAALAATEPPPLQPITGEAPKS